MSEMRLCSTMDHQGLTKFGDQAKPLKYSEKSCILYQFRADVQIWPLTLTCIQE